MTGFRRATKAQAKLRLALIGPSGSGKTYSALAIATGLGQRIAVIDTEHGTASKYSDRFTFDVMELSSFAPQRYIEGMHEAAQSGYDVLIIDSLSHAWAGKDGLLEFVDRVTKRSQSGNTFMAWRDATPQHNALVDALIRVPMHLIVTMRAKTEYVIERDERTGKSLPRKIGLQAIQRDGLEYEFDVVGDINLEHQLVVSKTRYPDIADAVLLKPGREFGAQLASWLSDGVPVAPPAPTTAQDPTAMPQPDAVSLATRDQTPANGSHTEPAISPAQVKRLWIIAREAGWRDEELKGVLQTRYGLASSKAIPRRLYDEICALVTAGVEVSDAITE